MGESLGERENASFFLTTLLIFAPFLSKFSFHLYL